MQIDGHSASRQKIFRSLQAGGIKSWKNFLEGFANRRNQVLNPTSSLALEVLNAFEALADSTENKKTMIDAIARISVDYRYVTPVRQRAYKLLKTISPSNSSDAKKKNSKKSNTNETSETTVIEEQIIRL